MRWLAELRTLARPERPDAPPPSIGELAPDTFGPGPRLVVFLRHVGCPFAEATARELELWRRRVPTLPVSILSQGEGHQLAQWLKSIQATGLEVKVDEGAYLEWRIPVTSAGHFLGPRSLARAVGLAARGLRNRYPAGSRWLSAATFLLDLENRVVWRHLPAHAGELPELGEAIPILESLMISGRLAGRAAGRSAGGVEPGRRLDA